MKIVGFIVEYNPFHNGHLYHLQRAMEVTNADAAIVVMSGDYVQRGIPALLPKRMRAQAALECGVAAVFELPVCYATGSAELFAFGAVSLLDALGAVDSICFGSECGDLSILQKLADILYEEPHDYRETLKAALKSGRSFPAARKCAVSAYLTARQMPDCSALLDEPNNILAIEYLKALRKRNSTIRPYTIQRAGSDYRDTSLQPALSSAAAIRALFETADDALLLHTLANQIPPCQLTQLKTGYQQSYPIFPNDFSLLLKYRLLTGTKKELTAYQDVSEELANRIINRQNDFINYVAFAKLLKTRELTQTRIFRALLHILLDIKASDVQAWLTDEMHYYARLLGFRKDAAGVLSEISRRSTLPLLTKPCCSAGLCENGQRMLENDLFSSNLYQSVVTDKYHTAFAHEASQAVLKV